MRKLKYNDPWEVAIGNGFRFLTRADIENIIKELHIDRNRFHEYSKQHYQEIIRKFLFTFSYITNYTAQSTMSLALNSINFRSELKSENIDCYYRTRCWSEYIKTIKESIPENEQKLFLILGEGWVYEGEIEEMFRVLNEVTYLKDFYIVSPKFTWFIAVSDMEDSATIYNR